MRKLILPAVLAAFTFLAPQAHASWLSEWLHQARGDYNYPGYYAPSYGYAPAYGYPGYTPGDAGVPYSGYDTGYAYTPGYVTPPVYSGPSYYTVPAYPYGYGAYSGSGYYRRH